MEHHEVAGCHSVLGETIGIDHLVIGELPKPHGILVRALASRGTGVPGCILQEPLDVLEELLLCGPGIFVLNSRLAGLAVLLRTTVLS